MSARKHESRSATPMPVDAESSRFQFSLAALLLVMTLVAVCLGVFLVWPGLGLLLVFIAVPALIRTMMESGYQRRAGAAISLGEKVEVFLLCLFFLGSLDLAMIVFLFVGLLNPCSDSRALLAGTKTPVENAFENALILGLIAAVPLAAWMLWVVRPSQGSAQKSNK